MTPPLLFDHALLAQRRARAATHFAEHDFLFREAEARVLERLDDIKRTFSSALNLSAWDVALPVRDIVTQGIGENLSLSPAQFDLVVSVFELHWANDLPGALIQLRHALRPDGLFVACVVGGGSLHELRRCLMEAELEITGGAAPRVSPMLDVQDAAALLQRAGFALPVADREILTLTYADPLALLRDLRGMGETNVLLGRSRKPLRRAVLNDALARYQNYYADADGRVSATIELIFLTGWAPHASQPQPLKPGSATQSLKNALKT